MAVARTLVWNPAGVDASGNVSTYGAVANNIGAAADDRTIVVFAGTELANSGPSAATIDFGFGPVDMIPGTLGNLGAMYIRAFWLPISIGTQAEIKVWYGSTNPTAAQNHIFVYRVTGAGLPPSVENVVNDTDADPITTPSVTIAAGGGMLAACADANDTTARTWGNLTEDADEASGTGGFRFSAASSITAGASARTCSGNNQEDATLSYLIFASGAPSPVMRYLAATALTVAAPTLGAPTLTEIEGPKVLNATPLTVAAPTIGIATFTQTHVLVPTGLAVAAPVIDAGEFTQNHTLAAANLAVAAPTLGAPTLEAIEGAIELAATPLTVAAPTLGTPTLNQDHALAPADLSVAAPVIGVGTLTQHHILSAANLGVAGPVFGAPTLSPGATVYDLAANSISVAGPTLGAPALTQKHNLSGVGIDVAAPSLGQPTLNQSNALSAESLVLAAPVIGQPILLQHHMLQALGLTVSAPSLPTPSLSSGIRLIMGDYPLDHGLNSFVDVDKILVCSDLPTDYADALAKELGEYDFGAGNAFGAPEEGTPGRRVVSAPVAGGTTIAGGNVACWAAIDSANSRLFARGPLNGGGPLALGQSWGLESFSLHITGD